MAENFGSFFSDVGGGEGECCKPHSVSPSALSAALRNGRKIRGCEVTYV